MSHLTSVRFVAGYEPEIINTIFDAMDCSLISTRRFGRETRWFSGFPQFTLVKERKWNSEEREINRMNEKFIISCDKLNELYQKIFKLFPNGEFTTRSKHVYPITVHQIFSLGENLWAHTDGQSVFFHIFKGLPSEYKEWSEACIGFDYAYMMSDSSNTYRAGNAEEERINKLRKDLDNRTCILWYNYVLGRMRVRPQDASFGVHIKADWNTVEEAYKFFEITPSVQNVSDFLEVLDPVNTPCTGFAPHPKRVGWMQGDYDIDPLYSNAKQWGKAEYEKHLMNEALFKDLIKYLQQAMKEHPKWNEHYIPGVYYDICESKSSSIKYAFDWKWALELDGTHFKFFKV